MDNENLNKIFSSTECLSNEKMIDYLDNNLLEKDKNSVEIHLSSCEMCQDEFEGLKQISDKTALHNTVFELNSKVDKMMAATNKKIPFLMPLNLMAAIILFIIGFAWYFTYYIHSSLLQKKDLVSQSMEFAPDRNNGEILIIRPESSLSESEKNLEKAKTIEKILRERNNSNLNLGENNSGVYKDKNLKKEISKNKVITKSESTNLEDIKYKNDSGIVNSSLAENEINDEFSVNERKENIISTELDDSNLSNSSKDIAVAEESKQNRSKKSDLIKTNKSVSLSNTVRTDNFNLAMAEYEKRDYRAAIELFKQSMNENIGQDKIHFYLAMSYENIKSLSEALDNYNKVISNLQSPHYEQALWNKSQILIQLNKRKSAINTLNQLKKLNGTYSKQAEMKLDSLNIK